MIKSTNKKVLVMFGASFLSIALGLVVSIFNSRILGPKLFGDYKFIETVARFISSLVSVGFFVSLTRLVAINKVKSTENQYVGLFTVIFCITSILGIFFYLVFSFVEPFLFTNEFSSSIWRYFFMVASIIGYAAILELLKGLHRINTIALTSILPIGLYLIFASLINYFTVISIDTVLFLTYGITLFIVLVIIIWLKPNFSIGKKLVKDLMTENKFNGRPVYFGSLAGVATTHIAGLSIAFFLNTKQVGFFMLAMTICSPLLVVPSVLGTIFFKQFVDIKAIPAKVYYLSITTTLLALVIFYTLIEFVVVTFYTEAYLPVAGMSKYLIIGFIFHGFGDLINRFLGAKGKGVWLRNAAFLVGIVNVLGYLILIKYFAINGAIITKIFASCLYLTVMIFYYLNFIKNNKNV